MATSRFIPILKDEPVEAEIARNITDIAKRFCELGHSVTEETMSVNLDEADEAWSTLTAAGANHAISAFKSAEFDLLGPKARKLIENGNQISATYAI